MMVRFAGGFMPISGEHTLAQWRLFPLADESHAARVRHGKTPSNVVDCGLWCVASFPTTNCAPPRAVVIHGVARQAQGRGDSKC